MGREQARNQLLQVAENLTIMLISDANLNYTGTYIWGALPPFKSNEVVLTPEQNQN